MGKSGDKKVESNARTRKHRGPGMYRPPTKSFLSGVILSLPLFLGICVFSLGGPWYFVSLLTRPPERFPFVLTGGGSNGRKLVVLTMEREGNTIRGSWEDLADGRIGLLEGRAGWDGRLNLEFRGNFRRRSSFEGRFLVLHAGLSGTFVRNIHPFGSAPESDSGTDSIFFGRKGVPAIARKSRHGEGASAMIAGFGQERVDARSPATSTGIEPVARSFREWTYRLASAGAVVSSVAIRETMVATGRMITTVRHTSRGLPEGRELGPDDLFLPGTEGKLAELLTARALLEAGPGEGSLVARFGFFSDIILPGNEIFICLSGIGFGYDRYRLAPYQIGDFRFVIPWKDMEGLVYPGTTERYKPAREVGSATGRSG